MTTPIPQPEPVAIADLLPRLATATPVEIDTALATLNTEAATATLRAEKALEDVANGLGLRLATQTRGWAARLPVATTDEVLAQAEGLVVPVRGVAAYRQQTRIADDANATASILDGEYRARGGWTRAFLVTSSAGMVHSTMGCSTCYPQTRFSWLPQVSGWDEAAIVDAAGEEACTVCYPAAPAGTRNRPSRLLNADRAAAAVAREARAAKAAAKAAKATADALIDPTTGDLIRGGGWAGRRGDVFKTERTATSEYVENAAYLQAAGRMPTVVGTGRVDEAADYCGRFLAALAAKRGVTPADVEADLAKKVTARLRRDYSFAGF